MHSTWLKNLTKMLLAYVFPAVVIVVTLVKVNFLKMCTYFGALMGDECVKGNSCMCLYCESNRGTFCRCCACVLPFHFFWNVWILGFFLLLQTRQCAFCIRAICMSNYSKSCSVHQLPVTIGRKRRTRRCRRAGGIRSVTKSHRIPASISNRPKHADAQAYAPSYSDIRQLSTFAYKWDFS